MSPTDSTANPSRAAALTAREREVLALLAAGESTSAIGTRLGVALNTIKTHLTSVYRKTGSRNRVQAVRFYLDHLAPEEQPAAETPLARPGAPTEKSIIQRQIDELHERIEQLAPVAAELERLHHALDSLRAIEPE